MVVRRCLERSIVCPRPRPRVLSVLGASSFADALFYGDGDGDGDDSVALNLNQLGSAIQNETPDFSEWADIV